MTDSSGAQRRILLMVPNQRRDLEGHALVAYHLVRRYGHEVAFGNVPGLEEAILRHAPDAVVLDRVDTRSRSVTLAKSLGMKVALLPTVGFTPDGTEIEARRAGKLTPLGQRVDCCMTWGEQARETLLAHMSLLPTQVHTVGCPRFDAYSEPYVSLVEPRELFVGRLGLADPRAPLVVWTTNTYHQRTRDLESTVASAVASGVPESEIREHLAQEGTAFRDLAEATSVLARRHPEWNFLIKLHPAEAPEPYRKLAAGASNIALATDGRIRDVLYHCDALMANCSTTATEAWMLGKPVFEVAFGSYVWSMPRDYLESNHLVTDMSQLETLLGQCLQGRAEPVPEAQRRSRDEFLRRVYYRIDGKAGERCAAHLHQLVSEPTHGTAEHTRIRTASASAYAVWKAGSDRRVSNRIKDALRISRGATLRVWTPEFWRRPAACRTSSAWDQAVPAELVGRLFEQFDAAHAGTPGR